MRYCRSFPMSTYTTACTRNKFVDDVTNCGETSEQSYCSRFVGTRVGNRLIIKLGYRDCLNGKMPFVYNASKGVLDTQRRTVKWIELAK